MSSAPPTEAPVPVRRRASIWRTASLKLAAALALLIALGGAALVIGLDYAIVRFVEAETREGLEHQMDVMRADAARLGTAGLVRQLESEPQNRQARRYLFLVEAPDGASFSNGLTAAVVNDSGFQRNRPGASGAVRPPRWPDQTPDMLVLGSRAADGGLLAVGRDAQHLNDLRAAMRAIAMWVGAGLVLLTLLSGAVAGWLFLRRLDEVNRAAARIMAGARGERLPAIGFSREFDELAGNLNVMLDRQAAALDALRTLSESVAHELRAPLNRLRNRLEEVEALAPGHPAVARASEEMQQLDALFGALLALARLESGAGRLDRRRADARDLVGAVGEIYRPAVEEAGGALRIDLPSAPLPIEADSSLVQQALANLVENAIFHGGAPPRIAVSCAQDGAAVVMSVADRGPGIPPAERDKVVRRFYRLGNGGGTPGAGLGLALVSAVAEAHGGTLALRDNAPGLLAELRLPAA